MIRPLPPHIRADLATLRAWLVRWDAYTLFIPLAVVRRMVPGLAALRRLLDWAEGR